MKKLFLLFFLFSVSLNAANLKIVPVQQKTLPNGNAYGLESGIYFELTNLQPFIMYKLQYSEDLRKWTWEEIESTPGRLAAQIVFNQLIRNKFFMWFVGNVEGNQLYTVTLSNKEKALVSFTNESIACNYINRGGIIKQINESF